MGKVDGPGVVVNKTPMADRTRGKAALTIAQSQPLPGAVYPLRVYERKSGRSGEPVHPLANKEK